jgi:hypothetical protein
VNLFQKRALAARIPQERITPILILALHRIKVIVDRYLSPLNLSTYDVMLLASIDTRRVSVESLKGLFPSDEMDVDCTLGRLHNRCLVDRRGDCVRLTLAGRGFLEAAKELVMPAHEELRGPLTVEEFNICCVFLRRIAGIETQVSGAIVSIDRRLPTSQVETALALIAAE